MTVPAVSADFIDVAGTPDQQTPAIDKNKKYAHYYAVQIENIQAFFRDENFTVAAAAFEYLLDLKKGKMRKNGYIPDHAHEIDQILPLMTCLKYGPLKEDRAAIEAQYGSIEKWFLGKIVHDIGEDFNVFPKELMEELRTRVSRTQNYVNQDEEDLIQRAAHSMERLTHYRKFSVEQIENLTGKSLHNLPTKPGEVIPLDKEIEDILWNKMNILKHGRENLQLYAKWDEKKGRPIIILTRYGKSNINTPQEEVQFGPEWTLYIHKLIISGHPSGDEEQDFYDALVKMADRVNGLATRIAISGDKMDSYDAYLDETELLFSHYDAANMMINHLYKGTPLAPYIRSEDAMMGLLHRIGRIYSKHHPSKERNGDKGESLGNMITIGKEGINPLKFSNFFPNCEQNYIYVPQPSHPIALIFRDLRATTHPKFGETHKQFYKLYRSAITENGLHLEYIISGRPEHRKSSNDNQPALLKPYSK